MGTKLYHVELGLPYNLNLPEAVEVRITDHALRATTDDRYGDIVLPIAYGRLQLKGMGLVELETLDNGKPVKIVVRGTYQPNPRFDLVLVLTSSGILKTCWLNDASDGHATLNRSRYTIPK
jgi:hypothetical protein